MRIRTDQVSLILKDAAEISSRLGARVYNTYHILLSLIRNDQWIQEYLRGKGLGMNDLLLHAGERSESEPFLNKLMGMMTTMTKKAGVGRQPIHLLYAVIAFARQSAAREVISYYWPPENLAREIVVNRWHQNPPGVETDDSEKSQERELLNFLGRDFTEEARRGKIKPVIGREKEIRAVVEILARKGGGRLNEAINNPVLLGDAGTGKTAIAKGIARLIAAKDPSVRILWSHRLVYLSLASLMANTGLRGSLEGRFQRLLEECQNRPTILFLDELHTIMGLGQTEGSPGLEQMLKPVLAEGLSCIGATTTDEWQNKVERKDKPFAERWIPVPVEQTSAEETLQILFAIADDLAAMHLVHFPVEVFTAAVNLGRKYMPYQASPRREVELVISGVGAKAKLANSIMATPDDVAEVISQMTGQTVLLDEEGTRQIADSFELIRQKVVGQDEAVRAVSDLLKRRQSGLQDETKPPVILELGPTGVGKSLLAETLAQMFFQGHLVPLDMSEYMEKHTVSRLIGAPPGYLRSDEPGQLTEPIRRLGQAVILLDEIEKAHPDVFNVLLQLFDKGRLTDSHGRTVNAQHCVFLMTSNLGSRKFSGGPARIGFGAPSSSAEKPYEETREEVLAETRGFFSPEFLNRVDEIIVFRQLTPEVISQIADLKLGEEKTKCSRLGFILNWTEEVKNLLIHQGFSREYGARHLKRLITRSISDLLSGPVLRREIIQGDVIELNAQNGVITWSKKFPATT